MRKLLALALLFVATPAHAVDIAFKVGKGIQVSAGTTVPTAVTGRGVLWFKSTDHKLHLLDDLGADTALGAGGGGGSSTLATAYTTGTSQTDSTMLLDATRLGVRIRDNATPITGALFSVQSSGGSSTWFDIGTSPAAVRFGLNLTPTTDLGNTLGTSTLRFSTLYTPTVQDSTSVSLKSSAADGAAAVASIVDTTTAWSNATAKLVSFRSNAVEKTFIDKDGYIKSAGTTIRFLDSSNNGFTVEGNLPQVRVAGSGAWQWYNTYFIPISDFAGSVGLAGYRLTEVWSRRYAGVRQAVAFSATPTFDAASGELITITMTANITSWTFTAGLVGEVATIEFIQDGTGSRTLAGTPANVLLAGGALTLTTTLNKRDAITFRYDDGLAKWVEIARSLNL